MIKSMSEEVSDRDSQSTSFYHDERYVDYDQRGESKWIRSPVRFQIVTRKNQDGPVITTNAFVTPPTDYFIIDDSECRPVRHLVLGVRSDTAFL